MRPKEAQQKKVQREDVVEDPARYHMCARRRRGSTRRERNPPLPKIDLRVIAGKFRREPLKTHMSRKTEEDKTNNDTSRKLG